jgi:hypothetical protein
MALMQPRHTTVTAVWIILNVLPLLGIGLVSVAFESWMLGLFLLILYLLLFIPYGLFVSLPMMVKIFRRPASPHRR